MKWPTDWAKHPGDVQIVRDLLTKSPLLAPYAFVTPEGEWVEHPDYWMLPDPQHEKAKVEWENYVSALLKSNPDATAVVVDCHN